MQYWDIIGRSFRISWQHKYLWLIAFFAGESGASYNVNYNYSFQRQPAAIGTHGQPDFGAVQSQFSAWFHDNLGLLALLAVLSLILAVGFFVLGAACEGATIRASAEHDAERPFDLRAAWQVGVERMWVIVRFRLLLLALGLPLFIIFAGLVAGILAAAFSGRIGTALGLGLLTLLVGLLAIPYVIYLSFLDRFGSRAAVLELLTARASLAHAHRLLFKRLGRALLVWLLSIAVGIGVGIAIGLVGAIVFVPLAVLVYSAFNGGLSWFWAALLALVAVPFVLVTGSYFAAQTSTYWTLAYRRMDVEYPRANTYPPQPAPQR